MTGIYKITDQTNGKIYIGQSNDIERRWSEHRKNSKNGTTLLYQAMQQHGLENFIFEIIEECSLEELNNREQYYIDYFDSSNTGYNMNNVDRPQYTITESIASKIREDLRNSSLNQNQIAEKYNISHSLVSQINTGRMWHDDKNVYPIRKNYSKENKSHFCKDCGKPIGYKSIRCIECDNLFRKQHIKDTVSREELKEKIRTIPFTEIARKFNTTDKAIKRWCSFYNLPNRKKDINSYSDEEWEKI